MKILAKVGAIFDRTIGYLAFVAAALIIFTMLAVSAQIVMRYFLNRAMIWVMEVTEITLLLITLLGTAWLLRREGHVQVDILISHLNPRAQAALGIISSIIGIIVCVVLVWYGIQASYDAIQTGLYEPTLLELPKGPLLTIIPAGSFLLLIQFFRRTYWNLQQWRASPYEGERG